MRRLSQFASLNQKKLPVGTDYNDVYGLRLEAVEKLNKVQPASIGQASRISGVSPADISLLTVWLEHRKGNGNVS